jgi:mono/diheme cytochrome c family protein
VDGDTKRIDPRNLPYSPQYTLWTDGAAKRRWIRIPEGERIDASNPDRWNVPVGTRFYKEFSFGRPSETRLIEKLPDGSFRFATYVWNREGTDAVLAPAEGVRGIAEVAPGVRHDAPSVSDCKSCHEGRTGAILAFGALALSPERDPNAAHAEPKGPADLDLPELARRGLIEGLPAELLRRPPRIQAKSAEERAALGYLYANCAGCHNADGPLAGVGLDFDVLVREGGKSRARSTAFDRPSHIKLPGHEAAPRIAPGNPENSTVLVRMKSREAVAQMPPLGTRVADQAGIDLVERFIARTSD